jgi:hypothetical protein
MQRLACVMCIVVTEQRAGASDCHCHCNQKGVNLQVHDNKRHAVASFFLNACNAQLRNVHIN